VCLFLCVFLCVCVCVFVCRVGQNRTYAPYMTIYLVIFQPKLPYIHCIYMVLGNPRVVCCLTICACVCVFVCVYVCVYVCVVCVYVCVCLRARSDHFKAALNLCAVSLKIYDAFDVLLTTPCVHFDLSRAAHDF